MPNILHTVTEAARRRALGVAEPSKRQIYKAIDASIDDLAEGQTISGFANLEGSLRADVAHQLVGFGALQPFLDDPEVEELWINEPNQVFTAKSGVQSSLEVDLSAEQLQAIIERMLRHTGRRIDRSVPFVDASLADGSRLHVVIPDITKNHWSINIRKFNRRLLGLSDLVAAGSIPETQARLLSEAMIAGQNILISGATQAGKTTMLCALLAAVAPGERVVSVEETFEVWVNHQDWVALQTRQPNLEGVGEVSLRRLVKEALRMRPSRIVVGEVREAESLDLLIALNSGLPGLSTIHANSGRDAILKLCTLPLLAGQNITSSFVNPTVGACIDLVVHCELTSSRLRRVKEIVRPKWNASAQVFNFEQLYEVQA